MGTWASHPIATSRASATPGILFRSCGRLRGCDGDMTVKVSVAPTTAAETEAARHVACSLKTSAKSVSSESLPENSIKRAVVYKIHLNSGPETGNRVDDYPKSVAGARSLLGESIDRELARSGRNKECNRICSRIITSVRVLTRRDRLCVALQSVFQWVAADLDVELRERVIKIWSDLDRDRVSVNCDCRSSDERAARTGVARSGAGVYVERCRCSVRVRSVGPSPSSEVIATEVDRIKIHLVKLIRKRILATFTVIHTSVVSTAEFVAGAAKSFSECAAVSRGVTRITNALGLVDRNNARIDQNFALFGIAARLFGVVASLSSRGSFGNSARNADTGFVACGVEGAAISAIPTGRLRAIRTSHTLPVCIADFIVGAACVNASVGFFQLLFLLFLLFLLALLDAAFGVIGGVSVGGSPSGSPSGGLSASVTGCEGERGVDRIGMDRDVSGGRRSDRSRGPSGRRRKTNILG